MADKSSMSIAGVALGGMQNAEFKLEKTAQRIAGAPTPARDSVDLSSEMVSVLEARQQFQSSVRVFQTGDQMQKRLLDILA